MSNPVTTPNPTGFDPYHPTEIARRIEAAGQAKARLALLPLGTLGMLGGAFIGLGALFFLAVLSGADPGFGPARLAAGLAFSLGLILVLIGGAELFTGNVLLVMAWVDGVVGTRDVLRNWVVVYATNFLGALALVGLVFMAGLHTGPLGQLAARLAVAKYQLGVAELLARGTLCNMLVCLAVWLSFAARDVAGRILAIAFPIAAFVTLGLEHCVANMFLLPFAQMAGGPGDIAAMADNLFWVSIGNVLGGAGGVALTYWAAYRAGG